MNKKNCPDSCYDSDCTYVYCDHCNHRDMEAISDIGTVSSYHSQFKNISKRSILHYQLYYIHLQPI